MKSNNFYHNPRCRKSREGLKLLESKNVKFEIVEYLKIPPSEKDLKFILEQLNVKPLEIIRTQEKIFKDLNLSKKDNRTDQEWICIMIKHPILLERPILVYNNKAALGRPAENLLQII